MAPPTAASDKPERRDHSSLVPGVPDSLVKDLGSPDARMRLLALNHWTAQETTAPPDSVFAALEDEDEAVRAKAAEIIGRYWTLRQGRN